MKILPHIIEPPVFWNRVIKGYYAIGVTPYLLAASGKWFLCALSGILLGISGIVIFLLATKKGYDTGWLKTAAYLSFIPTIIAMISGVVIFLSMLSQSWD